MYGHWSPLEFCSQIYCYWPTKVMNCRGVFGRGFGHERPFAVAPSSVMSWSSRCCDSLQTFICVLVTCMCFLYPSTLFVVIFPSHGLWFTYEVGCIQLPFVQKLRMTFDRTVRRSEPRMMRTFRTYSTEFLSILTTIHHIHPKSIMNNRIRPLGRPQHR